MIKRRSSCWGRAAVLGVLAGACDLPEPDPGDPGDPGDLGQVVTLPLGVGFTPLSMEPGDFDGDGAADVLIGGVSGVGGTVGAVLRGNDDGTLQPAIDAGLNACSAYPVVGDLDGDARSDVIALGCGSTLATFLGQPDGTLAPWAAWPNPTYSPLPVTNLAIGDFEGDGDGDVFVLRQDAGGALVHVEQSNGAHGFWGDGDTRFEPDDAGFSPTQMSLADLDGTPPLDLVLTDGGHAVARWLGAPPDGFAFPLELDVSVAPWLTRVGDLNDDGFDDLVVVGRMDVAVQVLLSAGDGSLVPLPPVPLPFPPYDAALGDLDGDGDLDVALVDDLTPQVYALRGDGAGGLGNAMQRPLPSGAIRVHAADYDGDAIDDVLAATFADGSLSLVLSTMP